MRKILLVSIVLATILSMSNCKEKEEEDTSLYTLIGTWEAKRDFTHTDGVQWNENNTLIFTETEFRQEILYKSTAREVTQITAGKYTYDDNTITFIDTYEYNADGSKGYGPYKNLSYPYKFTNKNTLETNGFGDNGGNLIDRVYKRKN